MRILICVYYTIWKIVCIVNVVIMKNILKRLKTNFIVTLSLNKKEGILISMGCLILSQVTFYPHVAEIR